MLLTHDVRAGLRGHALLNNTTPPLHRKMPSMTHPRQGTNGLKKVLQLPRAHVSRLQVAHKHGGVGGINRLFEMGDRGEGKEGRKEGVCMNYSTPLRIDLLLLFYIQYKT